LSVFENDRLLSPRLKIVRDNVKDAVPKLVMLTLVRCTQDKLQDMLVSQLYKESEFPMMLQESPEAIAARHTAKKQLAAVAQANAILAHQDLRDLTNRY